MAMGILRRQMLSLCFGAILDQLPALMVLM
jgi:hypothetical protein